MRRYDANPALSAFAVVGGAVLGIVVAVLLGLGTFGGLVLAIVGIAVVGLAVSALGLVGDRASTERPDDDLPSHYHDY